VLEEIPKEPYFLGEGLSQADITAGAMMGYIKLRPDHAPPAGAYPSLDKLSDRLEALDAFRAARPSPQETMPATVRG
jgi:glutathione S-transferase